MRLTLDRLILLLIAASLAVGLALSEFARMRQQSANDSLSERLTETTRKADAALQAVIEPETIANAYSSIYMVTHNDRHYGTAFVIDRDRGILATAAHVAVEFDFDAEEKPYAIINRHSGKALPIKNAKIHSGFFRFRKLVENHQPLDLDSPLIRPNIVRIYDLAHDGALIFVDPIDPETGENILGPNMTLESEEALAKIGPGDPIAILGFPVDTLTDNIAEESAAPRAERGVIASMIAPIDLVEETGDPRFDNLIIHRMASAPGNSGGPVINTAGKVVGINSHGTSSYHSNGDKLAQRSDVIYDLLDAFREQETIETLYFPEWRRRLAKWPKLEDALPTAIYHRFNRENGAKPDLKAKLSDLEIKEDPEFTTRIMHPEFGPVDAEFILLADDLIEKQEEEADKKPKRPSREQNAAQRPTFVVTGHGQFANFQLPLSPKKNHAVFAFDYSLSWQSGGYCPVQLYYRRVKDTVLRSSPMGFMPMQYFPADKEKKGVSPVDFVIRRRPCDPSSNKFIFGVVSWDDVEEPKEDETAVVADAGQMVLTKAVAIRSDLQNAVDCNLEAIGDQDQCRREIKIRNFTPAKD